MPAFSKALVGLLAIAQVLYAAPVAEQDRSTEVQNAVYQRGEHQAYDNALPAVGHPVQVRSEIVARDDADSDALKKYAQLFGVAEGLQLERRTDSDDVTNVKELPGKGEGRIKIPEENGLMRRTDFNMNLMAGWGATWIGRIPEPPNSGWNFQTIKGFAKEGFEKIDAQQPGVVTAVSALWIPGSGCYLGSIPHDEGKDHFPNVAPVVARRLWGVIKNRKIIVDNVDTKYHAEDMAAFNYERMVGEASKPAGDQYPEGSYVATYGRRNAGEGPGPMAACSDFQTAIRPSCNEAMHDLNVAV